MMLKALTDYYEVLAKKGKVEKQGWSKLNVSYGVVIDEEGTVQNIVPLFVKAERGKKLVDVPLNIAVPEHVKRAVNIAANYLCDNSTYIFGYEQKKKDSDKDSDRAKRCFEDCKRLHLEVLKDCNSQQSRAVINFFGKWNPDDTEKVLDKFCTEKAKTEILTKGANLLLMPFEKKPTEYSDLTKAWDIHNADNSGENESVCLVTGKRMSIARLHPSVKGVRDASAMGASLVSFNGDAFTSFGKSQGENSPVSEYAAFAYTTALNYLLSNRRHVSVMGDTTVICWAEDDNEGCQDIFDEIFNGGDNISQADLESIVKKISLGEHISFKGIPINPSNNFYILGLAPNSARLSVRFFLRNTFGGFITNIEKHYERMSIVKSFDTDEKYVPFWRVLFETVNKKSKDKSAKPQLAGAYLYSVLTNTNYPETLFLNIIIRINAEQDINYVKASAIKAYLNKKYKEGLTVSVDKTRTDLPYVLGRLFSVLEEIQSSANPGINTTIKDRYFSSASSTPALVFPTLVDLAQNHLRKIRNANQPAYVKLSKELTELYSMIDVPALPATLSLQEKGMFQIGYYHQTQYRFTKNKEEK